MLARLMPLSYEVNQSTTSPWHDLHSKNAACRCGEKPGFWQVHKQFVFLFHVCDKVKHIISTMEQGYLTSAFNSFPCNPSLSLRSVAAIPPPFLPSSPWHLGLIVLSNNLELCYHNFPKTQRQPSSGTKSGVALVVVYITIRPVHASIPSQNPRDRVRSDSISNSFNRCEIPSLGGA